LIEVSNLSRRYGDFVAVDEVSFSVGDGEILGMLGPNGAGKTTTIRMITGFLPLSGGRVSVGGVDLVREPVAARRRIGYLPENVSLYMEMRVREYLRYRGQLVGLPRPRIGAAIDRAIERCLLGDVRDQIIGTLSKGYRQRVGLAMAILHDPEVLILDEPTVGLDPKQIIAIRELIRELGRERTLMLSTHILPEVELLCDRVQILDGGRIVAEGSPESLRERWLGAASFDVELEGAGAEAAEALGLVVGVAAVLPGGGANRFRVQCAEGADPRAAIFELAVARGWQLVGLAPSKRTLEDVFVRLTAGEQVLAADAAPEARPLGESAVDDPEVAP
jgi:ABC-2 type transport system ATP-binding protein